MKPDFTLLGTPAKRMLVWLGFCCAVKAVSLVVFAYNLSLAIVAIIAHRSFEVNVWWAIAAALVRAIVQWIIVGVSSRTAIGVKANLQTQLLTKALKLPKNTEHTPAEINTLATTGLSTLDNYFTQFFPALVATSVIPWLLMAWIGYWDWISAFIILITIGLVPFFMVLIGLHTQDSTTKARAQLINISHQLIELAQGLPVIIGVGKVKQQGKAFTSILEKYRKKTLEVLRISFMSSFALELIATISVALVAVVIGVRLVYDKMPLDIGLMVLILAPECYLPLREIGAGHHASEDGVDTLKAAKAVLDEADAQPLITDHVSQTVQFENFQLGFSQGHFLGQPLTAQLPERGITALTGASGTGKSTILAAIAGLLTQDDLRVRGTMSHPAPEDIAYVPQHPRFYAQSVEDELKIYAPQLPAEQLAKLLSIEHALKLHPADLSPGEQRRLAIARAVMPIVLGQDKKEVVLLDEPTAHLDSQSAQEVREFIVKLGEHTSVLLVSHEAQTISLADQKIELATTGMLEEVEPHELKTFALGEHRAEEEKPEQLKSSLSIFSLMKELALNSKLYIYSIFLGIFAATAAIALSSTSAWLIVRASEHPPIMYLSVAIVGVRFFGIARATCRYFERLWMHDALFTSMESLRSNMWQNLAKLGLISRHMLSASRVVQIIVEQADQLRDVIPRAINPLIASWAAGITTVIVLTALQPSIFVYFIFLVIVGLIVIPWIAAMLENKTAQETLNIKAQRVQKTSSFLMACDDLKANHKTNVVFEEVNALNHAERNALQSISWRQGFTTMLSVGLAWSMSAFILIPAATWYNQGMVAGMIAVCALKPLAMTEIFLAANAAQVNLSNVKMLLGKVGFLLQKPQEEQKQSFEGQISAMRLENITARWSGQKTPALSGISFSLPDQGHNWLSVIGPSGSGKSTLLSVLMGFLPYEKGEYSLVSQEKNYQASTTDLTGKIAWCPQESHIFNSTLRGNLMLGASQPQQDQQLLQVLEKVGFTRKLENGLDTEVGASGAFLSGGERQRLAVARTLLSDANVVLLDEPTAHLDREAATLLMHDLRLALKDKLVVLITHHHEDIAATDHLLNL